MADSETKKSGSVAFVGRPNAGKSTLLNSLLEEKVAIVSDKPQTTRQRLVGIFTAEQGQMVIFDTPGVHRPKHRMNHRMNKAAKDTLSDADVVCLVIDASVPSGSGDRFMREWVAEVRAPKVAVLNKIDRIAKPRLLPLIASYADPPGELEAIVPISALRGDGLERLLEVVWQLLPVGEAKYDHELLTLHPERFLVSELIREKVLERTRDELPFVTAVTIDSWEERRSGTLVAIHASILAEREGQKKILVGAGGKAIKAIGTAARVELESFLEKKVFLDLRVRLAPGWREDPRILSELDRSGV